MVFHKFTLTVTIYFIIKIKKNGKSEISSTTPYFRRLHLILEGNMLRMINEFELFFIKIRFCGARRTSMHNTLIFKGGFLH